MNSPSAACEFQLSYVVANNIVLHIAETGVGPPIIFLHGFPEHWRAFAPMMRQLGSQFHCLAPDQRGNNLSSRPIGIEAYQIDTLADDVAGLVSALGLIRVHIVAHDWGGLVAWHFASRYPDLLRRMVVFNAPHPFCLQNALDIDAGQRAASLYAAQFAQKDSHLAPMFQNPESLWSGFFAKDETNGWLNDADKWAILNAWQPEGAWQAMLNWYRAAGFDYSGSNNTEREVPIKVVAPTLLVWGEADTLFAPSSLHGLSDIVPDLHIKMIKDGGHCAFRENLDGCVSIVRSFLLES